jgi:hypothetical protein
MIVTRRTNIACDPRGKIKTGARRENGLPMGLDHWNLTPFPELIEWYGKEPKNLLIYFPSDNIADFFEDQYALYGGKAGKDATKVRSCNGEECIHRIDEEVAGVRYVKGQVTGCICKDIDAKDKKKCKYACYLRAFVANPQTGKVDNPMCYLFETHSENSGAAVHSEVEKLHVLTHGHIAMIPFMLSVKMVGGKTDAAQKFPIWSLAVVGTLSQIKDRVEKLMSSYQSQRAIASGALQIGPAGFDPGSSAPGEVRPKGIGQ